MPDLWAEAGEKLDAVSVRLGFRDQVERAAHLRTKPPCPKCGEPITATNTELIGWIGKDPVHGPCLPAIRRADEDS